MSYRDMRNYHRYGTPASAATLSATDLTVIPTNTIETCHLPSAGRLDLIVFAEQYFFCYGTAQLWGFLVDYYFLVLCLLATSNKTAITVNFLRL